MGYGLATLHHKPEIFKPSINKIKRKITGTKLGAIKRPTAEDIRKRGTQEEETEDAMSDTLKEIL